MSEPESDVEGLFTAARQLREPEQRLAFLVAACVGQPQLRRRLDRLLEVHPQADDFFGQPVETGALPAKGQISAEVLGTVQAPLAIPSAAPEYRSPADEAVGTLLGRYKLLQKIGEGGCGIVYMAEQIEPVHRRVALKVIRLGMDTESVIARFEAEQQALALMDHPNIARVLDVGATSAGRPFFVMELVRGIPFTRYCDELKLRTGDRLKLFVQVCQAIQHAHQKGIIHRDIKPSNVLVTVNDGVPVPKVIDFGIAKAIGGRLTERTFFTAFDHFIGTPAYVSPEQAEMNSLDIDTRSDIYSLGVLLYELLTGKTPFDVATLIASGLDEMRRRIREQEPLRPSTRLRTLSGEELTTTAQHRQAEGPKLIQRIRGDLDWIVMKCLEKERARRYETANALAADLKRHLQSEPVTARPPSALYRVQKMVQRHRFAFAAVTAISAVLVLGGFATVWEAIRATKAERGERRDLADAIVQRHIAEQNLYAADMKQAQQFVKDDDLNDALKLLNRHRPRAGETNDMRGFEWRYLWQRCQGDSHEFLPAVPGKIYWLELSPDGRYLAASADGGVLVFDMNSHNVIARPVQGNSPDGIPPCAIFTPDGKTLIAASDGQIKFFETAHWTKLPMTLTNTAGPIAISRDGMALATMRPPAADYNWGNANIINLSTLAVSAVLTNVAGPLVFSADGQRLATYTPEGIKLWPLTAPGESPIQLLGSSNLFVAELFFSTHEKTIAISSDGRLVAAGGGHGNVPIMLWNAMTGERLDEDKLTDHNSCIKGVVFSPDGQFLASCSLDHTVRIWDLAARKFRRKFLGHLSEVWSLAFAPDGKHLVSGGSDDRIRIWPMDVSSWQDEEESKDRWLPLWISTNGLEIITLESDRLDHWTTANGKVIHTVRPSEALPRAGLGPVEISPDGVSVFCGYQDGTIRFRSLASDPVSVLRGHNGPVTALAVSPDSRTVVSASEDLKLCWWELTSGQLLASNTLPGVISRIVFSPDGKMLATVKGDRVLLWDVTTRTRKPVSVWTWGGVAFSPDARKLVTNGGIQLWETTNGALLSKLEGNKQVVLGAVFSPDGRSVASAGADGTLRLYSVESHQEMLTWRRKGTDFDCPMFSADGRTLVAGSYSSDSGGIRIWRAPSFDEIDAMEKANRHNH